MFERSIQKNKLNFCVERVATFLCFEKLIVSMSITFPGDSRRVSHDVIQVNRRKFHRTCLREESVGRSIMVRVQSRVTLCFSLSPISETSGGWASLRIAPVRS